MSEARARWRRWLRRAGWIVASLLVLLIMTTTAVLWIPGLSRIVVEQALTRWDAGIPARVEWTEVSGSLAGGTRIEGLSVWDSEDQALVETGELVLVLDLGALITGEARVEGLVLRDVVVHVDHRWGDLSNPEAEPSPPSPGYGPDLPLLITAAAEVDGLRIVDDAGDRLALDRLGLTLTGEGRGATADLELRNIALPSAEALSSAELVVDAVDLRVVWAEPRVTIERLDVDMSLATLRLLGPTWLDVSTLEFALGLTTDANPRALAKQLALADRLPGGHPPEQLGLVLRGEGRLDAPTLDLRLDLGRDGELHLAGSGQRDATTGAAELRVELEARVGAGLVDPEQAELRLELLAHAARAVDGGLTAKLDLGLRDRGSGERVVLGASGSLARLPDDWGSADLADLVHVVGEGALELRGAGVSVDGQVELGSDPSASLAVSIPELARPLGLLADALGVASLGHVDGRVELSGSCAMTETTLRCPAKLELDRFAGFGVSLSTAQLDATLEPLRDEPWFDASLRAGGLRLAAAPIVLTELDAHVVGTAKALELRASGQGPEDSFEVAAKLRDSDGERRVEFESLSLTTSRGGAPMTLGATHPSAIIITDDRIELEDVGLELEGAQIIADGSVALTASGRNDLRLIVTELDLARLAPWIPGPRLHGTVVLDARVIGPRTALRGVVEFTGHDLALGDLEIGDVRLRARRGLDAPFAPASVRPAFVALADRPTAFASLHPDDLQLELTVAGPSFRRVELVAAIPVRGFGLGSGPLDVRLAVSTFELACLAPFMPAAPAWWQGGEGADPQRLSPAGQVDLDLVLTGSVAAPQGQLALRGANLALDGVALGSLLLRAKFEGEAAELELDLHPGFVAGLSVRARVPIELGLGRGRLRWAREREHIASVELAGVDLARIGRELGPSIPALAEGLAAAQLEGLLSASLQLHGSADQPGLDARLRGFGLGYRGTQLGDLRVDFAFAREQAELELRVDRTLAETLDARLVWSMRVDPGSATPIVIFPEARIEGAVRVESLALASLTPLTGVTLDGRASLDLTLDGSLAEPRATATLSVDQLATERGQVGELELRLGFAPDRLGVDLDLIRDGVHALALTAEVPLRTDLRGLASGEAELAWANEGSHRIMVTSRAIDPELLSAFVDLPPDLAGSVAIDLRGGGQLSDFQLDGDLRGQLREGDSAALDFVASLTLDEANQHLAITLTPERSTASVGAPSSKDAGFDAELDLEVPIVAFVRGDHELGATPFEVRVTAPNFQLDSLAGFMPPSLHDPQGQLEAEFRGSGVLAAPHLAGSIAVHDAAISVIPLRQRIRNVELELALTDDHIELSTLHISAGKGSIDGSGRASVTGDHSELSIALEIAELPLVRPGLPAMIIDAGIDVEVESRPSDLSVAVAVREPKLTVGATTEAAPKSIPKSTAIVFASDRESPGGSGELEPQLATNAEAGHLRLRLELVDPLQISGNAVDMVWSGSVALERTKGSLVATGELETQRGRIDLVGTRFEIVRGAVILPDDGSVDPYLDLVAVTKAGDYVVTASVQGRVSRPELTFSSNPGLDEYEILSLLVTGSPSISDVEEQALQAKAASLLAAVSSPRLQAKIDQALHIDRASLGFGESLDQPILTVGKRITPKVYVETSYHHNAPKDQNTGEIRVQYQFARRWLLETYFGDKAVGGVGTYWSRSMPPSRWRVSPAERERKKRARRAKRRQAR